MGTRKKGLDFAKHISEIIAKSSGFESHLKKVTILGGGDGTCQAELKVDADHVNPYNGLHGGYIVTLVDMITTYALMSKPCHPGVSVDINVNYLNGARLGDEVVIEANISKIGKYLAFIECTLRHKKDDTVIAKGTHMKYVQIKD
ncbi:acyl-coenzyme A thioesterase 13 [Drosophila madeirensis]|uniref:Acyl-coenzyme A thioesterase 13 n=1 Tax=Drosophila madeirensis TaxID=30013 RepID=A0AAU9FWG4_DROMD|nr:acyl-coenzyme A thioesterase 13 [Drosophila subobscura]XP_034657239.1 acyl-coenzyme A thioesterase 13 [Drosophila subobscura]